MQEAVPHFGCCLKLYALFGAWNLEYRTSLPTASIREPLDQKNQHLRLRDISKQYAFEDACDSLPSHLAVPQALVDSVLSVADALLGVRCFNIDFLVDERDASVCLIDMNDLPSYKHLQQPELIPHHIKLKLAS